MNHVEIKVGEFRAISEEKSLSELFLLALKLQKSDIHVYLDRLIKNREKHNNTKIKVGDTLDVQCALIGRNQEEQDLFEHVVKIVTSQIPNPYQASQIKVLEAFKMAVGIDGIALPIRFNFQELTDAGYDTKVVGCSAILLAKNTPQGYFVNATPGDSSDKIVLTEVIDQADTILQSVIKELAESDTLKEDAGHLLAAESLLAQAQYAKDVTPENKENYEKSFSKIIEFMTKRIMNEMKKPKEETDVMDVC